MESRDLRLDGLKFFLVCMVVVGHCIQPFRYDHVLTGWAYGIIYAFHMPLFVILSGYFFKVEATNKEVRKCLRLLETFVLVTLVYWVVGGKTYSWPLLRLGGCPSWYLFSLVCWRLAANFLLKRFPLNQVFGGSICIAVTTYVLLNTGEGILSVMRITQFCPYFLIGYAIKEGKIITERIPKWMPFLFTALSVVVLCTCASYALYTQEFQSIGMIHWSKLLAGGGIYLSKFLRSLFHGACGKLSDCQTLWQSSVARHYSFMPCTR